MHIHFDINKRLKIPVYQQLVDTVISGIQNNLISEGDQIPSINQIASQQKLARETVVKAFKILQQRGIIKPIHGKGYFVSTSKINLQHRVFILLDTLSAYKEVLYNAIKKEFANRAYLDVYFHHYNSKVFQKLIKDAAGNYTSYIILPINKKGVVDNTLKLLPPEKIFLIDQKPEVNCDQFSGVYQDFKKDVFSVLTQLEKKLSSYNKFILLFRNTITQVPKAIKTGFESFCIESELQFEVIESNAQFTPQKGEAFLVIDDEDLVFLVEHSIQQNWKIGKDIGIISYNETSLKKVVAGGISVISTDFSKMGKTVAQMILKSTSNLKANRCNFIDRGSL